LDPLQLVSEKIEEIEEVIENQSSVLRRRFSVQYYEKFVWEIAFDYVILIPRDGYWLFRRGGRNSGGGLRVRSRLSDVEIVEISGKSGASESQVLDKRRQRKRTVVFSFARFRVNLRGQHAEEAIENLERYLDAAFLAGLPFVRIIHGKVRKTPSNCT